MGEHKTKWEVVYEESDHTTIWKYNKEITNNGPYCVEIKYKKNYKHEPEKKKTLIDFVQKYKTKY
jgi:hypothetical protein